MITFENEVQIAHRATVELKEIYEVEGLLEKGYEPIIFTPQQVRAVRRALIDWEYYASKTEQKQNEG